MARNIEIKARVADPEELRARIAMLAGSDAERLIQRDTFFEVPSGRLKLREFSDRSAELIFYERSNQAGPRRSSYTRSAVPEPASMSELLGRLFPVKAVVRKKREVWLHGPTRIHLDEVEGLGSFVELEVVLGENESDADGERIAAELMSVLGIRPESLVGSAYVDLLIEGDG
jgi:predicted adenylyl cyclase CyaB